MFVTLRGPLVDRGLRLTSETGSEEVVDQVLNGGVLAKQRPGQAIHDDVRDHRTLGDQVHAQGGVLDVGQRSRRRERPTRRTDVGEAQRGVTAEVDVGGLVLVARDRDRAVDQGGRRHPLQPVVDHFDMEVELLGHEAVEALLRRHLAAIALARHADGAFLGDQHGGRLDVGGLELTGAVALADHRLAGSERADEGRQPTTAAIEHIELDRGSLEVDRTREERPSEEGGGTLDLLDHRVEFPSIIPGQRTIIEECGHLLNSRQRKRGLEGPILFVCGEMWKEDQPE